MKFKVGKRHEAIPAGEYNVILIEVKEGLFLKKRRLITMTFEVREGGYTGAQANAFVNADYESFSSHTKLFKWYSVVTGETLEPGEELDMDVFRDKVLRVLIATKESKKTGNPFSNVTDILKVVCEL